MIVIALAALAYTWFSGIFASLTSTAGTAVTTTTGAMATQITIEAAKKSTANIVNIVIRNVGTQSFDSSTSSVAVYIDNVLQTMAAPTFIGCTGPTVTPGCVVSYVTSAAVAGLCPGITCPGSTCANVTKVTIGTGLTNTANIVC